jgi:hypothetical protein
MRWQGWSKSEHFRSCVVIDIVRQVRGRYNGGITIVTFQILDLWEIVTPSDPYLEIWLVSERSRESWWIVNYFNLEIVKGH